MSIIARLHYVTHASHPRDQIDEVKRACEAGISWIQLRLKAASYSDWMQIAPYARDLTRSYHAVLIINDNVRIAKEVRADGVHLGLKDMDHCEARRMLGPDKTIGGTAHSLQEVIQLSRKPVDYIGLGPFRKSATKKDLAPLLGMSGIEQVLQLLKKEQNLPPIVAIGGICLRDVGSLRRRGIYGVAVSSDLAQTIREKKRAAVERYLEELEGNDS